MDTDIYDITEEGLERLRFDLRDWLDEGPSEEDLLKYAGEIKEGEKQSLIVDTVAVLSKWKLGELTTYLTEKKLYDGTDPTMFYTWYRVVALAARYDPSSVFTRVAEEDSRIAGYAPPADFHDFSVSFMKSFVSGLRLATAFTYLHQLPYLQSLSRAFPDIAAAQAYADEIKRMFIKDGQRLRSSLDQSLTDREADKKILLRPALFPELYIDELLVPDNHEEKTIHLSILLSCLSLLIETAVNGSWDLGVATEALWLHLQQQRERVVLAETVASYKVESGKDWRGEFFKNLYELWTEENVTNGQAKASLISYIRKIDARQLDTFRRSLELFWAQSSFMRVNFDPLPIEDVITALRAVTNRAQLSGIIEGVQENVYDYGQMDYLKTCMESMYEVMKTIPEQPFAAAYKNKPA